jgi:hypothetical protein
MPTFLSFNCCSQRPVPFFLRTEARPEGRVNRNFIHFDGAAWRDAMTMDMPNKSKVVFRLADGKTVKGSLNIGKYNRVADFLNSKESGPFLLVYDASMTGIKSTVIIINRKHIVWAAPE